MLIGLLLDKTIHVYYVFLSAMCKRSNIYCLCKRVKLQYTNKSHIVHFSRFQQYTSVLFLSDHNTLHILLWPYTNSELQQNFVGPPSFEILPYVFDILWTHCTKFGGIKNLGSPMPFLDRWSKTQVPNRGFSKRYPQVNL